MACLPVLNQLHPVGPVETVASFIAELSVCLSHDSPIHHLYRSGNKIDCRESCSDCWYIGTYQLVSLRRYTAYCQKITFVLEVKMSQELMHEFSQEFRRSAGVMTFSQVGIRQFAESLTWNINNANPDPQIILARSAPTEPGARPDAAWRKSEVDGAADPNGWFQEWIGSAWLTMIYARWEDHYRPLFARTHEVDKNLVKSQIMGDIRNLRNDVVHHNGIAGKNTAKNIVLNRFEPGEKIVLSIEDIWLLDDNLVVYIDSDEEAS